MTLEIYSKDPQTFSLSDSNKFKKDRFFYAFISLIGVIAIIFALFPYFVWQFSTIPRLTSQVKNVPIPKEQVLSITSTLDANVQVIQDPDGFSYFIPTNLSKRNLKTNRPKEFYISVPKLKINNATARVDNLDFKKNLSHFPGSALPGEIGNSFITGHSVLPQFNDPQNYNAIFTKLSDLEVGDKVYVEIEDQKLQYIVQYAKIVKSQDTSVLMPLSKNSKNLTLMTCVPPGTHLKRLVVITSLI